VSAAAASAPPARARGNLLWGDVRFTLLTAGYADGPDELDEALEQGRQSPISPFLPRGALADE